jgi:hypothetical protein
VRRRRGAELAGATAVVRSRSPPTSWQAARAAGAVIAPPSTTGHVPGAIAAAWLPGCAGGVRRRGSVAGATHRSSVPAPVCTFRTQLHRAAVSAGRSPPANCTGKKDGGNYSFVEFVLVLRQTLLFDRSCTRNVKECRAAPIGISYSCARVLVAPSGFLRRLRS